MSKWVSQITLLLVWCATVSMGFAVLEKHSFLPGASARATGRGKSIAGSISNRSTSTLLIFLHPECSCSRATLEELDGLMTRCQGRLLVRVFIFQPSARPTGWSRGSLWDTAERIPGVTVQSDYDAAVAKTLGVTTSGQVLLYDANGKLVFDGGITGSRGHVGDNDGADAVIDQVMGGTTKVTRTPVFGCALYDSSN